MTESRDAIWGNLVKIYPDLSVDMSHIPILRIRTALQLALAHQCLLRTPSILSEISIILIALQTIKADLGRYREDNPQDRIDKILTDFSCDSMALLHIAQSTRYELMYLVNQNTGPYNIVYRTRQYLDICRCRF